MSAVIRQMMTIW